MARRVIVQDGSLRSMFEPCPRGFFPVFCSSAARVLADKGGGATTGHIGGTTLVLREPIGVVAAIVPWNATPAIAVMKMPPALAAGCNV
jgi:aldehyde dehydrogenase (NAD+)